jgi:gliding motility-associated protein GldE
LDDPSIYFLIIFWIILIVSSGLISATEVAFFSLTPSDLSEVRNSKENKNKLIIKQLSHPKLLLATILIANNIINIAIIILATYIFESNLIYSISPIFSETWFQIILITFILLLFGEVLPKVFANNKPKFVAIKMSIPINIISKIVSPLSYLLIKLTGFLNNSFDKYKENPSIENLSKAVNITSNEDEIEENKFLEGIVQFGKTDVKEIMKSRIDVVSIDISTQFNELIKKVLKSGYSRIPVFEENLDNIKGVLHIKDLLPYINDNSFDWTKVLRAPFFAPETKKIDDLLKEIKKIKQHLVIVVDEYGGTSGIVTLEDIIEEIIGEISDEFDQEDVIYSKLETHTYIFQGKVALKDFYRITDLKNTFFEERKGDADTLAGFIIENFGSIPKKGEKYSFKNIDFIIEGANKTRITSIKVKINEK